MRFCDPSLPAAFSRDVLQTWKQTRSGVRNARTGRLPQPPPKEPRPLPGARGGLSLSLRGPRMRRRDGGKAATPGGRAWRGGGGGGGVRGRRKRKSAGPEVDGGDVGGGAEAGGSRRCYGRALPPDQQVREAVGGGGVQLT